MEHCDCCQVDLSPVEIVRLRLWSAPGSERLCMTCRDLVALECSEKVFTPALLADFLLVGRSLVGRVAA